MNENPEIEPVPEIVTTMKKSKIQFDSGNQIYDVHLFIPLDFKGTKEEIEEIIDNHASWIKCMLMVKCGYGLDDNGEWVKIKYEEHNEQPR